MSIEGSTNSTSIDKDSINCLFVVEKLINNIIFDWNGTLMDDTLFTMNIENEMLAKRGMNTLTLEKYKEWFDFPVINYYVKMGYDFTKEPYEKLSV